MKINKAKVLIVAILYMFLVDASFPLFCIGDDQSTHQGKKRDPFVALVYSDGKIKTWEELFPRSKAQPLTVKVSLNAIIWDEERPLVLINNKVYGEGQEVSRGLIVEKVHPNSVDLNNQGSIVTLQLRKTEKKWIEDVK